MKYLRDFPRIPLLNKEAVRGNFADLRNPDFQGNYYRAHTSGSTGSSLEILHSADFVSWVDAGQWRAREWFGVDIGQRSLYLWGLPLDSLWKAKGALLKARIKNIMVVSAFELSDITLEMHWKRIQRFKPIYIYGYASSIFRLAQFLKERKLSPDFQCKVIITTAETVFEYQKKIIRSVFNCPVVQEYGCSEVGAFAYECPQGNMHIYSENVFVELLKDGLPVPPGKDGVITVTGLNNYCLPLIRYQLDDIGFFPDGDCPCKRGLSLMGLRVGKITDTFVTKSGKIFSSELFDYINLELLKNDISGIRQFRVTRVGVEHFKVEIVKGWPFLGESVEFFLRKMREFCGQEIKVEVYFVDGIPVENNGKLRYFKDELSKDPDN
jgi:phenylacetate-CoA ligase